jgi:hypothetical protein
MMWRQNADHEQKRETGDVRTGPASQLARPDRDPRCHRTNSMSVRA